MLHRTKPCAPDVLCPCTFSVLLGRPSKQVQSALNLRHWAVLCVFLMAGAHLVRFSHIDGKLLSKCVQWTLLWGLKSSGSSLTAAWKFTWISSGRSTFRDWTSINNLMCTLYVIFQAKVLGGFIISYLPGIGPGSWGVRTPTPNEPILSRATNWAIFFA